MVTKGKQKQRTDEEVGTDIHTTTCKQITDHVLAYSTRNYTQ